MFLAQKQHRNDFMGLKTEIYWKLQFQLKMCLPL